jgi:hypothetical protein
MRPDVLSAYAQMSAVLTDALREKRAVPGHERISMTQNVYMNRQTVDSSAADALADIEPGG